MLAFFTITETTMATLTLSETFVVVFVVCHEVTSVVAGLCHDEYG